MGFNILEMMAQYKAMKNAVDETNERLEKVSVEGTAYEGEITVTVNGRRKITGVTFSSALNLDQEKLAEMFRIAANRALEKAEKVYETEMQQVAKENLPNLPGI